VDSSEPYATVAADRGLTDEDLAYIQANFVPLEELCQGRKEQAERVRALMHEGKLPLPAYVLDDGTEMVASDYFALLDDAAEIESLGALFSRRYRQAAATVGAEVTEASVEDDWQAYLSGEYAVCLRHVTPENVFRKGWLTTEIEHLLAESRPDDRRWSDRLTALVDELDALEREFAPYDRRRWGSVSRDRLITAVRKKYDLSLPG
jgi:Family of unknown function (DUF6058)